MSWAWLRKELREHWAAFLGWAGAAVAVFGLLAIGFVFDATHGSWLVLSWRFAIGWGLLGTTYLAGRLIRREYASHTQLFLEALPVSRVRVLTTKLVLGALMVTAVTLLAIAVCAAVDATVQPPPSGLLLRNAARTLSFALWVWAVLAMGGLLGRYRTPLLLLLVVGAFMVDQLTELDLLSVGPARLMAGDLPYEATAWPAQALATTWAVSAAALAVCYALVLVKDGALTTLLADRMSHREKVFVGCILIGCLFATSFLDRPQEQQPFQLQESVAVTVEGTLVEVAPATDWPEQEARSLATRLAEKVEATRQELGLSGGQRVSIVPTRELDPDVHQRARVSGARGIVFRANVSHPRFDEGGLAMYVLHEVVGDASGRRAGVEPRHWVLDGYSSWRGENERLNWLRAASLPEHRATQRGLSRWLETEEAEGSCMASGLAATAIATLWELAGPERTRKLLIAALARPPPPFVWLPGVEPPISELLWSEAGITEEALVRDWRARLDETRRQRADELRALPTLHPRVELSALSPATFELLHALDLSPAPAEPARYGVRYFQLSPFDLPLAEDALELHEAPTGQPPVAIPRVFARGERWFWTVELRTEALNCSVRALAERREIR